MRALRQLSSAEEKVRLILQAGAGIGENDMADGILFIIAGASVKMRVIWRDLTARVRMSSSNRARSRRRIS